MAVFDYVALAGVGGASASGTVAADTPRQARDLLRERGLIVRGVTLREPAKKKSSLLRRRVRHDELSELYREVATLLGVGMPLLEVLDTSAAQHAGALRAAMIMLRDRVSGGSGLSEAMQEQSGIFDELAINLVRVGEDAGTLDASLERLADFRDRGKQFRNRIATAMIYPTIVALVGSAATLFLMTFVVPRILAPLIEQGMDLPLPTRVVKGASDFLLAQGWMVLIVLVAMGLLATFVLRDESARERWRFRWHRLVLATPILGDLAVKQAVVRLCVMMGMLLRSGIVFVRALEIAEQATDNRVIRRAMQQCQTAIVAGGDIALALENSGAFPPMVVQVFALGEQSGRLEEMLDRLAVAYEAQTAAAGARLNAVLEPAIIIALAMVILLVVLATVMPILEVGNAIQ